jgi:hypothetical protein
MSLVVVRVVLLMLAAIGISSTFAWAAGVRPLFDLAHPSGGPFPSDRFTVPDPNQNTGVRVNLPRVDTQGLPLDCMAQRSECDDIDLLNELDGFNSLPRISIPFDGDIDVTSVSSVTVFLMSLGSALPHAMGPGKLIGINRRVWDVATRTLHLEPDDLLDQLSLLKSRPSRWSCDLAG